MKNKVKNKSLFRQIIDIHYEQAQRHKALRLLEKQEWSVEFIEYLVIHAAKELNKNIVVTVTSPAGHKLDIKSVNVQSKLEADDDIFNKLDDEAAVQAFIREHSRR